MTSAKTKRRYRISYDMWSELVKRIGKDARDIVVDIDHMRRGLKGLFTKHTELFLRDDKSHGVYPLPDILEDFEKTFSDNPTGGVDSSTTPPIRLVNYLYSIVSSSSVIYEEGKKSQPKFKIFARGVRAPDLAEPSYARIELELEMFDIELEALNHTVTSLTKKHAGKAPVLFLDGPIVDPPSFLGTASRAGEEFADYYKEYARKRAQQVLRVLEAGGIVVGYVKRVYGNLFATHLSRDNDELREYIGKHSISDFSLISLCKDILMDRFCRNESKDYIIAFKEFSLPGETLDVELYREQGLEVKTFYIIPRLCSRINDSRPVRIEVAISLDKAGSRELVDEMVRKAVTVVSGWLIPGTGIPEPVLLAHKRCTIRRREARKILRELATRFIEREALRENPIKAAYIARTLIA